MIQHEVSRLYTIKLCVMLTAFLQLFERLGLELQLVTPTSPTAPKTTPFTEFKSNLPTLRSDRPALLISSTSWTADEDFTPLITALDSYQTSKNAAIIKLPSLVVLITGKGPLRSPFESIVRKKQATTWKDIIVRCIFVSANDYPLLLGSADLGISLHSSSSGRDLPMKIVDMFGCGIPVLARDFPCLNELVKEGKNGMVFQDGSELGKHMIVSSRNKGSSQPVSPFFNSTPMIKIIQSDRPPDGQDVLEGFPKSAKLDQLRSFFVRPLARSTGSPIPTASDEWSTWDENWKSVMQKSVLVWRKKME